MESAVPQFKHNDIIWAKVTGHPWWPGIIGQQTTLPNSSLYRVDFFGYPPSHCLLPSTKIIKYQDYHKLGECETTGRMDPRLKRAISEASILFHTLQQSKTSPINRAMTQSCIFQAQNTVTSACKSEERLCLQEKTINRDLEFHNSFSEHNQQNINRKCKRIKKRSLKAKINSSKEQSENTENATSELQELLRKYQLETIPDVPSKSMEEKSRNTIKLLYKVYRRYYGRAESMQMALAFKEKVNSKEEIKKAIGNARNEALKQIQTNQ